MVHVDLDGARHIFRAHGWAYPWPDDPLFESGMAQLLDFFEQRRLTATLFVIAEDLEIPAKRALILEACQRGHELASHTRSHRPLTQLDPAERLRELRLSKSLIEAETGVPVPGFRAPGFALDRNTLGLVAEAGYAYDSSLFGGTRAPKAGLATSTALPHRPVPDRDLVELPLPGYAGLPVPFHPSYSLLLGRQYFRVGLKRFVAREPAPFVFLLHLTDFAEPIGPGLSRGWRRTLFTLSMMSAAQKRKRLECMFDDVSRHFEWTRTEAVVGAFTARDGVAA